MKQFKSKTELLDFLDFVVRYAPDKFPSGHVEGHPYCYNVDLAFETLKANMPMLAQRAVDQASLAV